MIHYNSINRTIDNCTNDEDQRQELWLYYLSGNNIENIEKYLLHISKKRSIESIIQNRLWQLNTKRNSDKFNNFLLKLSNIERSIVILLALGLSVTEISEYKNITEIRIQQVISVMKDNYCWKELYGSKEETDS